MITYEAVFDSIKNDGVFGISLVENPAMEGMFVTLKEQEPIQFKEIDKEQRLLLGLVLEPNKPIYRNQNGEEFNIVFSEETIQELSHNFYRNGFQKNSTIEHESPINGVTFVESWTVVDPKIDKSANYGFSYPKGSWLAAMKVDSQEIWDNYVKTGKVKGFSVDAMIDLKRVNLKTDIKMSNKILDAIENGFKDFKAFLTEDKESTEVELGSVQSGELVIEFDGEALEVGAPVWSQDAEGGRMALPEGEYPLEDGRILLVNAEGMVGELRDAAAAPEAGQDMSDEQAKEIQNAIKSIMIKYHEDEQAKKKEQDEAMVALKKEVETLKGELTKLSEQPAARPRTTMPTQALNAKGRILSKLRQN